MDTQFLTRQKERIRRRIARYEGLSRDPNHERAAYADHKHKNILPRLREALYRMEKGTYGVCARCDGDIPRERLAIIPGALDVHHLPSTSAERAESKSEAALLCEAHDSPELAWSSETARRTRSSDPR
jgi:hypothetical protein